MPAAPWPGPASRAGLLDYPLRPRASGEWRGELAVHLSPRQSQRAGPAVWEPVRQHRPGERMHHTPKCPDTVWWRQESGIAYGVEKAEGSRYGYRLDIERLWGRELQLDRGNRLDARLTPRRPESPDQEGQGYPQDQQSQNDSSSTRHVERSAAARRIPARGRRPAAAHRPRGGSGIRAGWPVYP